MDFLLPDQGIYSGLSTPTMNMRFPDVLHWQEAPLSAEPACVTLGVDGAGKAIDVDLDSDSPHILISAATGAGKSVLARSIAVQAMTKGARLVILDAKRHSHRWAKNIEGIYYGSTLPEIGNLLVSMGMELHRRNEVVDEFPGPIEEAPVGPRIVVIFEEMNATMEQLKSLSRKLPRGSYTALDAFQDLMFLGRAAKMHIVALAQFATCEAVGGSAVRENFSTRVLIRYTKQAWTMLAYDCGYPQPAPEQKGRGMVCWGGKARQTQFVFMSEEDAAAIARQFQPTPMTYREHWQMYRNSRHAKAALGRARGGDGD